MEMASSEVTRDPTTLVYSLQCLRCGCTATLTKRLTVRTSCTCVCCHHNDTTCAYTGIDQCIDCHGKYSLHAGKTVWDAPYFACDNHCARTSKSLLAGNFTLPTVTTQRDHVNNVRNTLAHTTHKTLLHSAVLACDPDLTWDLLCRGANPFVRDRMGVTPVDLARIMLSAISSRSSSTDDSIISSTITNSDGQHSAPHPLSLSNEERVHLLLPKQAYPSISIELPPQPSRSSSSSNEPLQTQTPLQALQGDTYSVGRMRALSDVGPQSLKLHSPRSPHRKKKNKKRGSGSSKHIASPRHLGNRRDHSTGGIMQQQQQEKQEEEKSTVGCSGEQIKTTELDGQHTVPPSSSLLCNDTSSGALPPFIAGLRIHVPASTDTHADTTDIDLHNSSVMLDTWQIPRRRRAQTMTHAAPSSSSLLLFPPSPPRSCRHRDRGGYHHHGRARTRTTSKDENISLSISPQHHQHGSMSPSSSPTQPFHAHAHPSVQPHSPRRRPRSQSLSLSTTYTDADVAYAHTHTTNHSYGFARRQRGMSLTDNSPTAAALTDSKPILTGIVNAGIRHARVNAPHLSQGMQVFSPLTLLKMNSGNDFLMEGESQALNNNSDVVLDDRQSGHSVTDAADLCVEKMIPQSKGQVQQQEEELSFLKAVIIGEVEVEGGLQTTESSTVPSVSTPPCDTMFSEGRQKEQGVVEEHEKDQEDEDEDEEERDIYEDKEMAPLVSCTSCLDLLPPSAMAYSCPRSLPPPSSSSPRASSSAIGSLSLCNAHLCRDCLFRLVFVTITSALYAVPAIRCPGRCMCAVPTRLWRGGLSGMAVEEQDREGLHVTEVSMVALLDLLYEAFEVMCLDYEGGEEGGEEQKLARQRHTCTLLKRVEDVAEADGFTLQDVYNSVSDYTKSSGSSPPSEYSESDSEGDFGSDDSDWDDDNEKDEANVLEGNEATEVDSCACSRDNDDQNGHCDSKDVEHASGQLTAPPASNYHFTSFADFANFVFPGRVVTSEAVGATFMAMEDILNNSEVESARLNVKHIRKQHMHTFLAEVAALVRNRLDLSELRANIVAEDNKEDAEGLLMRRYMSNAQALLKIRCSGCDDTATLLHVPANGKPIMTTVAEREKVLRQLLAPIDSDEHAITLLRIYSNFMNGKAPSGLFITSVFEAFMHTKKCNSVADEERNEEFRKAAKHGILKPEAAKYFTKVLSLIIDMERRFAAQLELLRKFPKIKLLCCDAKHCFLCKVGGHHKGQTCTEVQQAERGADCQYCPGCGVATLRTEGCKEVLCVCGSVWQWEVEGEEEEDSESDWEDSGSDSGDDY